jgi:hypothetical protein
MAERMAGGSREDPRTISALLIEATREISALVRGEIRLAKAELREKAGQAFGAVGALVLGGVIVYSGFLVLLAAAVMGLAKLLPAGWSEPWISALIVAIVVLLVGFALLAKARSDLSASHLSLDRTAGSIGRDEAMVKEHVRKVG